MSSVLLLLLLLLQRCEFTTLITTYSIFFEGPGPSLRGKNSIITSFFFFFIYVGCPGQLTRITTIPHGPLDILQAQEQVRHRGDDRRAHRGSNPGRGRNKSYGWPQQLDPQVPIITSLLDIRGDLRYRHYSMYLIHQQI